MSVKNISSAILGVGVDDTTIDLFESQYPVPTGVSYTPTSSGTRRSPSSTPWTTALPTSGWQTSPRHWQGRSPPTSSSTTWSRTTARIWPASPPSTPRCRWWQRQDLPVYGAVLRRRGHRQGAPRRREGRREPFAGAHTLTFVFAPMVHWPEVMVSYESTEKVLFSADGFGRFARWQSSTRRPTGPARPAATT